MSMCGTCGEAIVEARNAMPELLDRLEKLERSNAELRDSERCLRASRDRHAEEASKYYAELMELRATIRDLDGGE